MPHYLFLHVLESRFSHDFVIFGPFYRASMATPTNFLFLFFSQHYIFVPVGICPIFLHVVTSFDISKAFWAGAIFCPFHKRLSHILKQQKPSGSGELLSNFCLGIHLFGDGKMYSVVNKLAYIWSKIYLFNVQFFSIKTENL